MNIVNINVERLSGFSLVTFRAEGGESIDITLADDDGATDDDATVEKARALMVQVAAFDLDQPRMDQDHEQRSEDPKATDPKPGYHQDVGSGSGYRGAFQGRQGA